MRKQFIIIGIIALFVSVGLSGCEQQISSNNQPPLSPEIKTVTISGLNIIQTINNTKNPVRLVVSGMNCVITVTKETNLSEVILSGMNSIVKVSRSHAFTSTVSGLNAKIVYYD